MNVPELRFRHSAPIAKHIPGNSAGSVPEYTMSDHKNGWIMSLTYPGQTSERFLNKSRVRWTLLGFVLGVAFWHVVGFWGFIGDIMLKGYSNSSTLMARIQQTEQPVSKATKAVVLQTNSVKREWTESRDTLHKTVTACTQLIMDRETRRTYSAPCDDQQTNTVKTPKLFQTASSNSQLDE